jgi:hypothetical protein
MHGTEGLANEKGLRSGGTGVVTPQMRKAAILIVLVFAVAVTAPAAGAANVRAAANKALVTTADLPAGWTASAHDSENDDATAKDIARCTGKPLVKKKVVVTGDDITDPSDSFMVASSVAVYESAAAAKKQFKLYQSAKYADCAQKHFETTPVGGAGGPLPTSVDVGKVKLDRYGDRTVGYGLQAEVPDTDGTTIEITSVQAAVLVGRAIARYQFNGSGEIFDQATGEAVLEKIDTRLGKAKL